MCIRDRGFTVAEISFGLLVFGDVHVDTDDASYIRVLVQNLSLIHIFTFTDVSPLILPSCALPVRIGGETDRAKSNPSMLGSISILQQSATRFECLVSQF